MSRREGKKRLGKITYWYNVRLKSPRNYQWVHHHTSDRETRISDVILLKKPAKENHHPLMLSRQLFDLIDCYYMARNVVHAEIFSYHNLYTKMNSKLHIFFIVKSTFEQRDKEKSQMKWLSIFQYSHLCFVFPLLINPCTPKWLNIKPKKSSLGRLIMRTNLIQWLQSHWLLPAKKYGLLSL